MHGLRPCVLRGEVFCGMTLVPHTSHILGWLPSTAYIRGVRPPWSRYSTPYWNTWEQGQTEHRDTAAETEVPTTSAGSEVARSNQVGHTHQLLHGTRLDTLHGCSVDLHGAGKLLGLPEIVPNSFTGWGRLQATAVGLVHVVSGRVGRRPPTGGFLWFLATPTGNLVITRGFYPNIAT